MMATSAIPQAALPTFINKPEEYGLYNPSQDWIDLTWGGRSMRLPGCEKISLTPCHFDDEAKTPVPGTLIIVDGYTAGLDGLIPKQGSPFNWKASAAIRMMLGIDVETGIAHSTKAGRGITFIPPVIDHDTFEAVKVDADIRYVSHEIAWAEAEVAARAQSVDLHQRAGEIAPAADAGYNKAILILSKSRGESPEKVAEATVNESDVGAIAAIEALAMEMAVEAAKGKEIDVKALADSLMKKPEVRKHLQKTYSIRKRGHQEEKVE
jgi:hypothetical protein